MVSKRKTANESPYLKQSRRPILNVIKRDFRYGGQRPKLKTKRNYPESEVIVSMREPTAPTEMREKDVIETLERKDHLWAAAGFAALGMALWAVFLL